MLIFAYFIIIFLLLARRGSRACGGVGFDVATGKFCVLDPGEIYAAGSEGWDGGRGGGVDQPEIK